MKKNNKGFTLVELIAVVVILGLLGSITMVSVSHYRANVNEKEKTALRSTIIGAFQIYRTNITVSENSPLALSELKFSRELSFNKIPCNVGKSNIKYIIEEPEKEDEINEQEIFCIQLVTDDETIINDYCDPKSACYNASECTN